MKSTIKNLGHEQFGQSSEGSVVLQQFELSLADMEEEASQAEAGGECGGKRQYQDGRL